MFELLGFLSLGFFGGFGHCIFMCNPFVIYIASKFGPNSPGYVRFFLPQIWYNLGRIITYGCLGLIFGSVSSAGKLFSDIVLFQKLLSIFAGIFLIAYATFDILGLKVVSKLENNVITRKISKLISMFRFNSPFLSGIVLGFLPCGLLYGALIGVTSLNSTIKSGIAMILFGIGTSASLLLIAIFGNIVFKYRTLFRVISFLIMTILGIFFIVSGVRF